jgi:hypothetical protein
MASVLEQKVRHFQGVDRGDLRTVMVQGKGKDKKQWAVQRHPQRASNVRAHRQFERQLSALRQMSKPNPILKAIYHISSHRLVTNRCICLSGFYSHMPGSEPVRDWILGATVEVIQAITAKKTMD